VRWSPEAQDLDAAQAFDFEEAGLGPNSIVLLPEWHHLGGHRSAGSTCRRPVASALQCASAPARSPRSAPFPSPVLATKKPHATILRARYHRSE
jgi:hypothetical protein